MTLAQLSRPAIVTLALSVLACACATTRNPAAYSGMPIASFANSLELEDERHVEAELVTTTVKILPFQRSFVEHMQKVSQEDHETSQANVLRATFSQWCQANGGVSTPTGAFASAADEYRIQRIARQPKLASMSVSASACLQPAGGYLGGYMNVANADIAFYDQKTLSTFIERFEPGARQRAKDEASRAELEASLDRKMDPMPQNEAKRLRVAESLSRLILQTGLLDGFNYLGSCVAKVGHGEKVSKILLGQLDRESLKNTQWNEVPTVGIVYHVMVSTHREAVRLSIVGRDPANQVVSMFEDLGELCGAW